jgi:hypothetical protein
LTAGYGVVLGQYLPRTPFIEDLAALARRLDVRFFEFVLDLDAPSLAARLALRALDPHYPEHVVNNRRVGPDDPGRLVESIEALRQGRPGAIWVNA